MLEVLHKQDEKERKQQLHSLKIRDQLVDTYNERVKRFLHDVSYIIMNA